MALSRTVFCYGDSNTWGYIPGSGERFPFSQRWTGILQANLGPDWRVIEEGLNGRTTVWDEPFRPGRNGAAILAALLEAHMPMDLVVLFLGTNDLKHWYHATADDAARGIRRLLAIVRETALNSTQVLLLSPPHIGVLAAEMATQFEHAAPQAREFAARYRAVAREFGCHFMNLAELIEPSPVDGIHLDEASHRILGLTLAQRIQQIFS